MCSKLVFKSKFGHGFAKKEEKSVATKKRVCEFFLGRIQMNLYRRPMRDLLYLGNKEIALKTLFTNSVIRNLGFLWQSTLAVFRSTLIPIFL